MLSVIAAMRHLSVVGGKRHLRCQIPQDSTVAGSIDFTEEEVDGRPCHCDARYRKVQPVSHPCVCQSTSRLIPL